LRLGAFFEMPPDSGRLSEREGRVHSAHLNDPNEAHRAIVKLS
jgi:hypothetical protein